MATAGTVAFLIAHGASRSYACRMTRQIVTGLLLLSFSYVAFAEKIPADAWQNGTLKGSEESWHSRSIGMLNTHSNSTIHGISASGEYPIVEYVIETPQYVYEAHLVLRRASDSQPLITVNGPIKFAIVKSDLFIQDEQGKQWKLVLTKKTLKTTEQQQQH
jgi:hypothetical protein